jgi:Peptidase family S41
VDRRFAPRGNRAALFQETIMAETETGARATLQRVGNADATIPLAKFLKTNDRKYKLSRKDRLRIVEQALLLIESNYVHLPLKRAMHAIDPIQRLRLLKFRLMEGKEGWLQDGLQFHKRMMEIFASTRDLHTVYKLDFFADQVAFLPFLIEQYFENGGRDEKFMVSRVQKDILHRTCSGREVDLFEQGVEVLYWNGVPIRRAIEMNGEAQAGSNLEARFARGLDNLTIRPLDMSLPPDELNGVYLTYRSLKGEELTLNQEWLVYELDDSLPDTPSTRKKRAALDIKKTKINQVKREFYVTKKAWEERHDRVRKGFEDIFYADVKRVGGKDLGYIRLFSFEAEDTDKFIAEFRRVITSPDFPQEGLIIDVRGNPGGEIKAGERLLQLFTPDRITPENFEFINSPLNLEICRRAPKNWPFAKWADSISDSVLTGATYSSGYPLTPEESCNDIGQVYHGPVILITDALSYSTTDIFAAGFQDNGVGEILGTSDNTGAGGANFWWYENLVYALRHSPDSPFKPLPDGVNLILAMLRSIRVGPQAGRPLEELGINPNHRHYLTKRDVLNQNNDLFRMAARILKQKPIYSLSVTLSAWKDDSREMVVRAASKIPLGSKVQHIARVDVCIADRPYKTIDARGGSIRARRLTLKRCAGKNNLLVQAFDSANKLVATYRHE